MNKEILNSIDILNKWIITKNISFIGYEWCSDSIFIVFVCEDITNHINIFFDNNECLINSYGNKQHLLSYPGNMNGCLNELDSILKNNENDNEK